MYDTKYNRQMSNNGRLRTSVPASLAIRSASKTEIGSATNLTLASVKSNMTYETTIINCQSARSRDARPRPQPRLSCGVGTPELDVGEQKECESDEQQSELVLPQVPQRRVCDALLRQVVFTCHTDNTHTHTRLTALFPGLPGSAGTRKVKLIWILLKQETVSGSGISWAICKSAPRSRQITVPAPHHSVFYRPEALPAAQPTASKH